jgi:hypothetical protein
MVSFTSRSLDPEGKSAWYPLGRRLGGTQSRCGKGDEEINFQLLIYKSTNPAII